MQDAFKRSKELSDGQTFVPPKENAHRVFSAKEEKLLATYTIKIAKMFYGLPKKEFRKLAYRYALACHSKAIPQAWTEKEEATHDWYYAYMARHPELTLKSPEGMSIARAIAFNKTTVNTFFDVYAEAMSKHQFTPDRIFNIDETSLSTVMKPVKVVCQKGQPVASQISRERGATMTFVGIINAAGHFLPPVFIIPRKRWNETFMRETIDGSKGILHQNGWMNGECFLETLQHVKAMTYCSVDNKIMLVMDNAECHMSIHAIEYAINNGIVIVTLPPHTTAKLQPLDVTVYGPFKTHLRALMNDFSLMHPHKHITEHMLPQLASKAWIKACTPTNVLSGFRVTGIWPINRNIFSDDDFVGAEVSARPDPAVDSSEDPENKETDNAEEVGLDRDEELHSATPSVTDDSADGESAAVPIYPEATIASNEPPMNPVAPPQPNTMSIPSVPRPKQTPTAFSTSPTPECIRPFPKAQAKPIGRGRKKVKSCILTENQLAISDLRAKEEKKKRKAQKEVAKNKRKDVARGRAKKKMQARDDNDSSEDDESVEMRLDDSFEYSDEVEEEDVELENPFEDKIPQPNDFVLVQLELEEGKNAGTEVYYVGKVLSCDMSEYTISFLRVSKKMGNKDTFFFPENEDITSVKEDKVKGVLGEPVVAMTKRLARYIRFKKSLSNFNIR